MFFSGRVRRLAHISIFTRGSTHDVGTDDWLSTRIFTTKSRGTSFYAVYDSRPAGDRDELMENIFADLLKMNCRRLDYKGAAFIAASRELATRRKRMGRG